MLKDNVSLFTTLALFLVAGASSAQTFTPSGDPEWDKRTWLALGPALTGSPSIAVNKLPYCNPNPPYSCTIMLGVLWPTLVQVQNFLSPIANGAPLIITGGSEPGHKAGVRSHANGFKVDLSIANKANTFGDPVSSYITSVAGKLTNMTNGTYCRNDGAPWYAPGGGSTPDPADSFLSMIFAMEYPFPEYDTAGYLGPVPCSPNTDEKYFEHGAGPACCHWDIQSSYSGLSVTPTTLPLNVGDMMSVLPTMSANGISIPNIQPWMFKYNFPNDPSQTIAAVDDTGSITGTAGTVIGVSCDAPPNAACASVLVVSQGPHYQEVNVIVPSTAGLPPGGGMVCPSASATSCWTWDPGTSSWDWTPPTPTTPTPNPPGNGSPPPGFPVCQSIGATLCWRWVPTANSGNGAWVFVPPNCGSCPPTTTTPPITPVSSLDPNAIAGPAGASAAQYISSISPAAYTIYFENDPTATAAADQVIVTDQIDLTRFDLTTLTLGPITFPEYPGVVPPSVPLQTLSGGQFSTYVTLSPSNLVAYVTVSLNSTTGLLTWTLQAIDPTTAMRPGDPTLGVLPIGGNGSVSFTVRLLPSLTTGTAINDQASVIFDTNAPISTAVWSNTLDVTPPTSSVSALPSTESATSFTVSWSGTDIGSGIQGYMIYVSDSGGPYGKWLTQTMSTSATFVGTAGHTYAFYSAATDFAGNTEAAKASPDTSTSVAAVCAQDSSTSFAITRGGFRLNHATEQFTQTVTIQNISSATIAAPISLVLDNLSSNASLAGGAGVTACDAPPNSSFVNLSSGSLAPGASGTITLTFTDPSQAGITYSTRVLTGSGER